MKTLTLNSYAKLNLYLSVGPARADKFHSIQTIFERIDLCDRITVARRQDSRMVFHCSDSRLPRGRGNLAVRAAMSLIRKYAPGQGVNIKLVKRIPAGAGLGGGSGNAATVLVGLNELLGLGLSVGQLCNLANEIGSDVAFFVHNCRFATGKGRGERIKPVPGLARRLLWHVIAVPNVHVSTPRIYRHWDKLRANKKIDTSRLTSPAYDAKLILLALKRNKGCSFELPLFNSLEPVTTDLYPAVRAVKQALAAVGLKNILMSGSGSSFFGIVSSRKEAVDFSRKLKKSHRLWRIFVAKTV